MDFKRMNDTIESMKFTHQLTTLVGLFDVKQVKNTLVCVTDMMELAFAILFHSLFILVNADHYQV